MFISVADLVILLALTFFAAFGFATGFIQVLGGFVGAILGAWLAAKIHAPIARWLDPYIPGDYIAAAVVAFVIIFGISNRLVGLLFFMAGKVLHLLTIIPFAKTINRVLGAILGLLEGIVVIGVIVYLISHLPAIPGLTEKLNQSVLAPFLNICVGWLLPILPKLLQQFTVQL